MAGTLEMGKVGDFVVEISLGIDPSLPKRQQLVTDRLPNEHSLFRHQLKPATTKHSYREQTAYLPPQWTVPKWKSTLRTQETLRGYKKLMKKSAK